MDKEIFLKEIYENIKNKAGFSGAHKLFRESNHHRRDITLTDVKKFLMKQRSHTLHGNITKRFLRSPVMVSGPGKILGSDLADMGEELKKYNKNYRYLLILIDIFSRKLYITCLRDKKNSTVSKEMENFLEHKTKFRYGKLWVDQGGEYVGSSMKRLLCKYNIEMYHVYNRRFKCAMAERVIQTIKRKLYKRMTHLNTYTYLDSLQDVVDVYNNTPHKGLKFNTPNYIHNLTDPMEIKKHAHQQYLQKLRNYGGYKRVNRWRTLSQTDILEEGTFVRILTTGAEGVFTKSFKQIYTEEVFIIRKVIKSFPTRYYLKDLSGEIIEGTVYKQEIRETCLPETFPIEKILKSKIDEKSGKRVHYVRFLGYPPKFDVWVNNIVKIK